MHFSIKKPALLTGLDKASSTVSAKDSDPLLKTFNIEADTETGELRILSTDLTLGSIARLKVVDIKEAGAICIDAKKLAAVVRAAEDTDIELKIENRQASITAGRASWTLNVFDAEEYPNVPRFDPASAEAVSREALLNAIKKVKYAAGTEETRPMLMMIAFNGERVAASDGSRLQMATFKGLKGLQIPIYSVSNLEALLRRSELEQVKVEIKDNHLLFQLGGDTFSTQRLFDEFPDVESMILSRAEKNDQKLTMDKSALLEAINRVRIAADDEKKQLDLIVVAPDNGATGSTPDTIQLTAEDGNGERAAETVHCTTTLSPDRRLLVNHQFLVEALEMNPDSQITMLLGDDDKKRSPIYMTGQGLKSVLLQLRPAPSE